MAFGDRKGKLLAAIGYVMNHLDSAKLASNNTRIRDKIRYFLEQG